MASAFPDLLGSMQGQLGRLYDVEVEHDVRDYLVTDRNLLAALTAGNPGRSAEEKLIVVEGEGNLDVALYLDQGVLERLAAADPRHGISGANLADFWTVLEGVSHFHYLAWNAAFDKPVTLLELEMQAEVDKYVSTRMLLQSQPDATLGGPLLQRLFDDTALDPALAPEEVDRYQAASALAGRYCAGLESRYPAAALTPEMLRELRTFYRLPQTAKIGRIRSRGFA
ncbi:MAG: hypothetical protein JNK40_07525 [Chromatiales bacterium]|nr:hypothetical protein [Chromatiales bacterium]